MTMMSRVSYGHKLRTCQNPTDDCSHPRGVSAEQGTVAPLNDSSLLPCLLRRGHFIIFSGGMPRASYGDRHCVTILQGQTLLTLDFTSRVIDFFTVGSTEAEDGT